MLTESAYLFAETRHRSLMHDSKRVERQTNRQTHRQTDRHHSHVLDDEELNPRVNQKGHYTQRQRERERTWIFG